MSNSDYRFDVKVPDGLAGLGSAPSAPFHGFAVFIDKSTCIVFLIEHRVVLPDDTPRAVTTRERRESAKVGNLKGAEKSVIGNAHGRRYVNTNVLIELPRADYVDDVSITLVSPLENRRSAEQVFRSFLAGFRFW